VLLTGTLRFQLDPFCCYSDEEVWEALDRVNLSATVRGLPKGLQENVAENGDNLSHGQRQLLCIARALIRKAKILIVDEGTSAVDPATDALIQTALRESAIRDGTTILAIAHRLSTIKDFDRILVLDKGEVVEFASPEELMADKASLFSQMLLHGNQ
jgi:ATP-binding cassette subfamily C (CFTR/MRP) protein 1